MACGIHPFNRKDAGDPVHASYSDAIVPRRPDDSSYVGSVASVGVIVIHWIAALIQNVIAVCSGSATTDPARIAPDVECQIGMAVFDSRVDHRPNDVFAESPEGLSRCVRLHGANRLIDKTGDFVIERAFAEQ